MAVPPVALERITRAPILSRRTPLITTIEPKKEEILKTLDTLESNMISLGPSTFSEKSAFLTTCKLFQMPVCIADEYREKLNEHVKTVVEKLMEIPRFLDVTDPVSFKRAVHDMWVGMQYERRAWVGLKRARSIKLEWNRFDGERFQIYDRYMFAKLVFEWNMDRLKHEGAEKRAKN